VRPERLQIGRNAVQLLHGGEIVNLGTGIPGDSIPPALEEAGLADSVTLTLESGVNGGEALGGANFGAAFGPDAIIDCASQFEFYAGGGLDVAFMGVGQLSPTGQVNVAGFDGDFVGAGGFLDITTHAKRVCFLMSTRGLEKKLRREVDFVCFDGQVARRAGREVFLVTEHHTYALEASGWRVVMTHGDPEAAVGLPAEWASDDR
jgi:propionate CoA-transferase